MGKLKDEATPDDSAIFEALIREALENRSDEFPENPEEFDVHVDNNYVFYMFIKNEWVNVGIDVSIIENP
jgi:hypothetical protein